MSLQPEPRTEPDSLALPPGPILNGAAIVMFVVALVRGSERTGDLSSIFVVAGVWALVLLAWLLRFAAGTGARTIRSSSALRWALAPSLFVIAGVLVFGGYALGVRFGLSRGALDAAADAALAGQPPPAGWIGLYSVERLTVDGTSVRVEVRDHDPFVRDAPPETIDSVVYYEPVDDRWSLEYDFAAFD